jgi:4-coumarate--CoA ligase
LPYSSGTTGLPKGVQLTHHNIVANVTQNSSPELPFIEETTDSHQDIIPVILPMFHIYGFTVNTLFILTKGTKLVTLPKFTPEDYVAVLRNHKPHILFLVPPIGETFGPVVNALRKRFQCCSWRHTRWSNKRICNQSG